MERLQDRFGIVLALILASLTVGLAAPAGDVARLLELLLQGSTLVVALAASRVRPIVLKITALATAILIGATLAPLLSAEELGESSARSINLLLLALASPAIARGLTVDVRETGAVTAPTMFGVLCIYLLVGLFFGTAFALLNTVASQPFFANGSGANADFLYFSFATLTTTGYGDFVAQTDLGRSLAITEALVGQIYLVTVVAVIVSNLRPREGRRAR